jgi:hypothetical protein
MSFRQFRLFRERRFLPFFGTQAFGAFNDNVYKNTLIIIVTFNATAYSGVDPALLTNLGNGLFILPYVVFSGIAGELADRFDRALLMRTVKVCECAIMALAGCGFAQHSVGALLAALFLMGAHSTFFAPAKYGLLPDILTPGELIGGNALLEMGTFVAILLGTLVAGLLASGNNLAVLITSLCGFSLIGLAFSFYIPRLAPAAPQLAIDWNIIRSSMRNLKAAQSDRVIFAAVLGISWFWFYGALILAQLPLFAKIQLHGNESVVTLLLLCFSIGVGTGSLACERLSRRRLEPGLIPLGAIGMSVFGLDLWVASRQPLVGPLAHWATLLGTLHGARVLSDLTLIGVSGGLYIVPFYALIQQRSPRVLMARVISAVNIWNALFMVLAALTGAFLLRHGISIPALFMVVSLANAVFGLSWFWHLPVLWLRCLVWFTSLKPLRPVLVTDTVVDSDPGPLLVLREPSFWSAVRLAAAVRRPMLAVSDTEGCRSSLRADLFGGGALSRASLSDMAPELELDGQPVMQRLPGGEPVVLFLSPSDPLPNWTERFETILAVSVKQSLSKAVVQLQRVPELNHSGC